MPDPRVPPPAVSPLVAKWPRATIKAIDLTSLMLGLPGPLIALGSIDDYLNACRVQQNRIRHSIKRINQRQSLRGSNLFAEVHFYLICVARIAKLAEFIAGLTQFGRVARVIKRYRKDLKAADDMRDHLEHFEERLPGGKSRLKLKVPNDLYNLHGTTVSIGGDRLDIGPSHYKMLKELVAELRAALLHDRLEDLALQDLKRLDTLLKRDVGGYYTMKNIKTVLKQHGLSLPTGSTW